MTSQEADITGAPVDTGERSPVVCSRRHSKFDGTIEVVDKRFGYRTPGLRYKTCRACRSEISRISKVYYANNREDILARAKERKDEALRAETLQRLAARRGAMDCQ